MIDLDVDTELKKIVFHKDLFDNERFTLILFVKIIIVITKSFTMFG